MPISLLCAKLAMDSAAEGIVIVDLSQKIQPIIYVNKGFVDITGYSAEEVIGKNCRFLQGKDTEKSSINAIRTAIDARKQYTGEVINYRKDGSMFYKCITVLIIEDDIVMRGIIASTLKKTYTVFQANDAENWDNSLYKLCTTCRFS